MSDNEAVMADGWDAQASMARHSRFDALSFAVELCQHRPQSLDSDTVLAVAEEFRKYLMEGPAQ